MQEIKKESRDILQQHFEEELPTELRKARILCDLVLKEAKEIMENTEDARTKTECLRLIHNVGLSKKDLLFDLKAIDPIVDMVVKAKQKFKDMSENNGNE